MYYDHTSEYSKRMQSVCIGKNTYSLCMDPYVQICSQLAKLFWCFLLSMFQMFLYTRIKIFKKAEMYTL